MGAGQGTIRFPTEEAAEIHGVETVHILHGREGIENGVLVNLRWEWELRQDAVEAWVGVELGDDAEEVRLGGVAGKADGLGEHAGFFASFRFRGDVAQRRRIVADEDGGKTGRHAVRAAGGGALRDLPPDIGRNGGTIDYLSCHAIQTSGSGRESQRGNRVLPRSNGHSEQVPKLPGMEPGEQCGHVKFKPWQDGRGGE